MDGAVNRFVSHHSFELLEINVTVTVRINGFDHRATFIERTLHSQAIQHHVELIGGDEAIFVVIVEVKGVAELAGAAVVGAGAAKLRELLEIDEAVVVDVEIVHYALEIVGLDAGSEGSEDVVEFGDGDLAVAVDVEAVEDSPEFVGVLEVH